MASFHFLNKIQPPQVTSLDLEPNTSCVLIKTRKIEVRPEAMPILQPDGVLVKVIATDESLRICGSDLHNYTHGGVGGRAVKEPIVMGHESAGEVIAVGDLVTTHKVGDRVAIEPGLPCRRCVNCKTGRINICLEAHYCGAPGSVGSLSRFFALPADMAPHIPDHVSWEEAGCIQPLAIGCQIAKRLDLGAHQSVAIVGCGPIGLITAAVAYAYSARKIVGFEISPRRVELARKLTSPVTGKPVFDHVFLVHDLPTTRPSAKTNGHAKGHSNGHLNGNGHDLTQKIGEEGVSEILGDGQIGAEEELEHDHDHPTPGDIKWEAAKELAAGWITETGEVAEFGFDRVVEASGCEDGGLMGIALAKQGAVYIAVGLGHLQTMLFPTLAVTNKEIDVRGITRYTAEAFPRAIDLLNRGQVDIKQMITKVLPLTKSTEAFEAVAARNDLKVIIKNQE